MFLRSLRAGLAAATAAALAVFSAGTAQAATLPYGYDFAAGFAATAAAPTTPPPGANDFSCRPTAAHPYPVILVHGTFGNMDDNWQTASPLLAAHGYCVFALNYGGATPTSIVQGTGDIAASAGQLASFVNTVLAATGAAKVDLVGHSQGGMMPRYYINFLGGDSTVDQLVGLASSNYGTASLGLFTLAGEVGSLLGIPPSTLLAACQACGQQGTGSSFLAHLNATPTVPAVRYTVIASRDDEAVIPYTNSFLPAAPNVTNITVQDQCSVDATDHLELAADPIALADVLNALDPAHPVQVPCVPVLPLTGPPGPVPAF